MGRDPIGSRPVGCAACGWMSLVRPGGTRTSAPEGPSSAAWKNRRSGQNPSSLDPRESPIGA